MCHETAVPFCRDGPTASLLPEIEMLTTIAVGLSVLFSCINLRAFA